MISTQLNMNKKKIIEMPQSTSFDIHLTANIGWFLSLLKNDITNPF